MGRRSPSAGIERRRRKDLLGTGGGQGTPARLDARGLQHTTMQPTTQRAVSGSSLAQGGFVGEGGLGLREAEARAGRQLSAPNRACEGLLLGYSASQPPWERAFAGVPGEPMGRRSPSAGIERRRKDLLGTGGGQGTPARLYV